MVMWSITAAAWTISNLDSQWFYFFFTIWARVLHYLDVIRLIVVITAKTVGMFTDRKTDYAIADGYSLDAGDVTLVSMK